MRAINARVSGPMIQEAALKFSSKFGVLDFKASSGWLEKFKLRNQITQKVLSGDSNEVSKELVEDFKANFKNFVRGYEMRDVFNADECGLFYKALPDKSLVIKGDPCKNGKMSKERITVLLAASSCGEKLTPLVIGKSKSPRAFKSVNVKNLPVIWRNNKRAWMTGEIFESWLELINKDMRKQKRKILLIVDNCPAHPNIQGLSNVELKFLPPNATSVLQPLDQGVIKNVKAFYRKFLLESLISQTFDMPLSEKKLSVSVLDAVLWLSASWKKVEVQTIQKCFKKAGFSLNSVEQEQIENVVDVNLPSVPDLNYDKEEYITFDNDLFICADVCMETVFEEVILERPCEEEDVLSDTSEEEVHTEQTYSQVVEPTVKDIQKHLREIKHFAASKCPHILCDVSNIETTLNEYICYNLKALKQPKINECFTKAHYKSYEV